MNSRQQWVLKNEMEACRLFPPVKDALRKPPVGAPYPTWGFGGQPEVPTEVMTADMVDPFLTQAYTTQKQE